MEPLQLLHCITYSRQGIWLSNHFSVKLSIICDKPHGTFLLMNYKYGYPILRLMDRI